MKKVSFFASLIAASMITGGITAYSVSKVSQTKMERAAAGSTFASSNHTRFTSYEPQKYPDLTYAAENAVKGVVNIEVTQVDNQRMPSDPFLEFFGFPGQGQQQPRERKGGGSGVIISSDGYIVTNNHVVNGATKLKVKLDDNRSFDAKIIGTDPTTDVALIKIEATELPTIPFGDSEALRLGEWVLAIGSPMGLQNTITAGIISAKARNLDAIRTQNRLESFIQTDAAINPGNSGGALVNTSGELVGINTIITSTTGSYIGYSFAIPSSMVKKVVVDLKEHGVVQRAMLGVSYNEINDAFIENMGKELGITEKGGIYVAEVDPEGAAHASGIKKGDIIIELNGVKIEGTANLSAEIAKYRPNDKVTVKVKRGGDVKQFDVVLRNKLGNTDVVTKDATAFEALGGELANVSDKTQKSLKIQGGVQVISIEPNGILAKARIRQGFIITYINGRSINSVNDLNRITDNIDHIEGIYPDGRSASYSLVR